MEDIYDEIWREKTRTQLDELGLQSSFELAWYHAVRFIPFISATQKPFSFWKQDNIQRYLYSFFAAFDWARFTIIDPKSVRARNELKLSELHSVRQQYVRGLNQVHSFNFRHDFDQSYSKVIDLIKEAEIDADRYSKKYGEAESALKFSRDLAAPSIALKITYYILEISKSTLQDDTDSALRMITALLQVYGSYFSEKPFSDGTKLEAFNLPAINTEAYGKVWDNFQTSLLEVECGYWGKLYKNVFESNIYDNHKELVQRMDLPIEIKEKGAAEVAKYIESISL